MTHNCSFKQSERNRWDFAIVRIVGARGDPDVRAGPNEAIKLCYDYPAAVPVESQVVFHGRRELNAFAGGRLTMRYGRD